MGSFIFFKNKMEENENKKNSNKEEDEVIEKIYQPLPSDYMTLGIPPNIKTNLKQYLKDVIDSRNYRDGIFEKKVQGRQLNLQNRKKIGKEEINNDDDMMLFNLSNLSENFSKRKKKKI